MGWLAREPKFPRRCGGGTRSGGLSCSGIQKGPSCLPFTFRAFGEGAARSRMGSWDQRVFKVNRRSKETRNDHFVGVSFPRDCCTGVTGGVRDSWAGMLESSHTLPLPTFLMPTSLTHASSFLPTQNQWPMTRVLRKRLQHFHLATRRYQERTCWEYLWAGTQRCSAATLIKLPLAATSLLPTKWPVLASRAIQTLSALYDVRGTKRKLR